MWVVSAYEKDGDRLIREHALGNVDVADLRRLWDRPDDDPMYDSYPVTAGNATAIGERLGEPLQLNEFDYFLEYMHQ
jgi:hypothetical protein